MSPLAKEVIEKLSNEEDTEILAEVLDFYEYMKYKKHKKIWNNIQEDDPDDTEKAICEQYQREEQELVGFNDLVQELGLDE
ncbi:hypothetical protein PBV87_19130 [Niameybacter massiliensis]|uniref:Uncharacterized protein n=1 Tax=Holtiella tumoricola TaxID=3018743 RepID=A0AA42J2D1_9FIRM|nr:hypothetical protein [Holtiella tumoricola]MDA3733594.1 hypothetical protein [Holtiella tumoricola]